MKKSRLPPCLPQQDRTNQFMFVSLLSVRLRGVIVQQLLQPTFQLDSFRFVQTGKSNRQWHRLLTSAFPCYILTLHYKVSRLIAAPNCLLNLVDGFVRRGGPGRDSHRVLWVKPFIADLFPGLHLVNAGAVEAAGFTKFARIVAIGTTHDDDDIDLAGEVDRCGLSLLGGLTDRVEKLHLGFGKPFSQLIDQCQNAIDWLGGLRADTEARP